MKTSFLAVDLGATSGRTVLATFDGQRIEMREFTRFENPQLPLGGHIFWDLPHLYNEIIRALRQVKAEGLELCSIGIDTWGCDFAFFGADGQLLGLPYCYRDPHTDGFMERYFEECMPKQQVYERTGIQFMPFNSLFHLYTQQSEGCIALQHAAKILFIPDALIYMLTGEAVCEYTVASTSQMLNPRTGDLDEELLASLGLSRDRFGRLVQPGEQVGTLTPQVQQATGLPAIPVIAVGSHDTASAVAAVPAQDGNFAYLSCGTWSLLGVESPAPIINADSFEENFTNEGGLDHTIRFLKNITGLCDYLTETRQPLPQTPADYVRVIFRSLAARYAEVVDILRRLTDVDIQRLHVIGGGSRNQYLMQFAADALQLPVIAGPQEGTALGNALVQVRAAGLVDSLAESRAIIASSIELKTYLPQ